MQYRSERQIATAQQPQPQADGIEPVVACDLAARKQMRIVQPQMQPRQHSHSHRQ